MRRTKPVLIGDVLNEFFQRPYVAARIAEANIEQTWRTAVGEHVFRLTTELRIENHILHARISSSVVRHEVFLQREALKDRLNEIAGVRIVNAVIIR